MSDTDMPKQTPQEKIQEIRGQMQRGEIPWNVGADRIAKIRAKEIPTDG